MSDPLAQLRGAVEKAAGDLANGQAARRAPDLERPKQEGHGDYATNAAMQLAGTMRKPPREIAELLGARLEGDLGGAIERVEVAGPGFLNLFLADAWYRESMGWLFAAGDDFGGGGAATRERINVEFVSANPTGPLTAAGGRHAAFGDALSRVLEFHGHEVEREYYINDFGSQVRKLGESIGARARGEEVPEDGYQGDYVRDLAAAIPNAAEADPDELARRGVELNVEGIRASLHTFGVDFDVWFSEASLHPDGVARAYEELERQGHLYRSEGAVWLRTTDLGDDKDRVLQRATGEPTYFASDIAYHEHKRERGYDRAIDVWGSDHHSHITRMQIAWQALGGDPDAFEVLLMQFVNIVEHGTAKQFSKRRGDFVTLDELVETIGVDAARFFMLQRSHDTTIDLDLDLAREESSENPVYYVQYAHARICSVLKKAGRAGEVPADEFELHPSERVLIKKLLAFPEEVAEAAERRAPHRITTYALELAQDFTAFYRDCRVVGAESPALESFRLAVCEVTRRTIARALGLLGVSAPAEM